MGYGTVYGMQQELKQMVEDVLTSGLFTPNEVEQELEDLEYEIELTRLLRISKEFAHFGGVRDF